VFGLQVELLTGRYVATAHNDRSASEWPPHPARLFSALVATWAENDPPDPGEHAALAWLEQAGDPAIRASEAFPRNAVTHYVPVNDATILSRTWLQKRAAKVDAARSELDAALDASGGDSTDRAVERALTTLTKHRDVAQDTSSPGKTSTKAAVALLPDHRVRQPREFPSMTPVEPRVEYLWPDATPTDQTMEILDALLARVVRLGHSSSMVACRLTSGESQPTWMPSADGDTFLRGFGPGQLAALESAYLRHQGSRPRTLPARGVRYRQQSAGIPTEPHEAPAPRLSGHWFAFEFLPPRRLPIWRAAEITRAVRDALMSHAPHIPEEMSGHQSDGAPSTKPHTAVMALPFVGNRHASGRLIGAAVLLPNSSALGSREPVLREAIARAIGAWEQSADGPMLLLGRSGRVGLRRVAVGDTLATLRRSTWDGPSRQWASVTPVALPRHPGDVNKGSDAKRRRAWVRAEEEVRRSCEHAGLPDPDAVSVGVQPLVHGAAPTHAFPAFRQFDRTQQRDIARLQVHVALEFGEPVRGPLLLGAGRYFGLGLMLPLGRRGNRA